jgi:hypothetical protein
VNLAKARSAIGQFKDVRSLDVRELDKIDEK